MNFLQSLLYDVGQFFKSIRTGDFKIGGGNIKIGIALESKKANDVTDETKANKVIHADGDALKEFQEAMSPITIIKESTAPNPPSLNDVYEATSDFLNFDTQNPSNPDSIDGGIEHNKKGEVIKAWKKQPKTNDTIFYLKKQLDELNKKQK